MQRKTLKKSNSLTEYLFGNNSNLIGTIIAIRKSLVKLDVFMDYYNDIQINKKTFIPESYAILLYFDHRKARLVRYLFNPNLTFWKKAPKIYNKNSIKYLSNEDLLKPFSQLNPYLFNFKSQLINEAPTILTDDNDIKHITDVSHNFKRLCDGKITKMMTTLFMTDLMRDYIIDHQKVYDIADMKLIREHTEPTKVVGLDDVFMSVETKIKQSSLNKIKYVDVNQILPYPDEKAIIYHQKSLNFSEVEETYNNLTNIYFEEKANKDFPQVIKDLRRFICPSTIENKKYLDDRINKFNRALEIKISHLK